MCIFLGEVNVVKIGPDSGLWPEPGTTRAEKTPAAKKTAGRAAAHYIMWDAVG